MLKSRKFKMALAGILGAVGAGLTGEVSWTQVLTTSIGVIAAYIVGTGIEDAGAKAGGSK